MCISCFSYGNGKAAINTFITLGSSPSRFTQTLSSHVMASSSIVLTQTSFITVWPPRAIVTGHTAVRSSPSWSTLTAIRSLTCALAIGRVTMCTMDTGTRSGTVETPDTLFTRLVTELTRPTTHTCASSCQWRITLSGSIDTTPTK